MGAIAPSSTYYKISQGEKVFELRQVRAVKSVAVPKVVSKLVEKLNLGKFVKKNRRLSSLRKRRSVL